MISDNTNSYELAEHAKINNVHGKKVFNVGPSGFVAEVSSDGSIPVSGLVTASYDYISLSYTSSNLTGVIFKTGGSTGTTVATLTLDYDGSNNLISVTKS